MVGRQREAKNVSQALIALVVALSLLLAPGVGAQTAVQALLTRDGRLQLSWDAASMAGTEEVCVGLPDTEPALLCAAAALGRMELAAPAGLGASLLLWTLPAEDGMQKQTVTINKEKLAGLPVITGPEDKQFLNESSPWAQYTPPKPTPTPVPEPEPTPVPVALAPARNVPPPLVTPTPEPEGQVQGAVSQPSGPIAPSAPRVTPLVPAAVARPKPAVRTSTVMGVVVFAMVAGAAVWWGCLRLGLGRD